MSTVNVLIVSRFGFHRGFLQDIASVDPRLSVRDATAQFVAEYRDSGVQGPILDMMTKESRSEVDVNAPQTREEAEELLAQAEIIFASLPLPKDLLQRAPKLRWLHRGGVGLDLKDTLLKSGLLESKVTITNSKGALSIPIAEQAMSFIFMLAKNSPRLFSDKINRQWGRFTTMELGGRTVNILGMGSIGSEIARLAKGLGMKVIATRRSATKHETGVSGIDEMYPPSELYKMLPRSDFLVIAAPLTEETRKMIGERELRAMKPSAYIINISRGQIVDQTALIRALKEGWIAGAGLDAFEVEPLPEDNELWRLPNVIISPHMAGSTDRRSHHLMECFQDNLRRYLSGKPLMNVIDKNTQY